MRNIFQFLDTNGDGTGSIHVTGDYSAEEEIFFYQPPIDQVTSVNSLIIYIEDAIGMRWDRYGGLAGPLTNGIQLRVSNDLGVIYDITKNAPIKTNGHWRKYCFDAQIDVKGGGNDIFGARWSLHKSGEPIGVKSTHLHERIELVVNDNFEGLIEHTFQIQVVNLNALI